MTTKQAQSPEQFLREFANAIEQALELDGSHETFNQTINGWVRLLELRERAAVAKTEERCLKGYPWSESIVKVGETMNYHGVVSITNNNDSDILVAVKRATPRLTTPNNTTNSPEERHETE